MMQRIFLKKIVGLLCVVFFILLAIQTENFNLSQIKYSQNITQNQSLTCSYSSFHLYIDGNENVGTYMDGGSGTQNNPYYLENREIDLENNELGIYIRNTNVFIEFRNIKISNFQYHGFYLSNTSNVKFINIEVGDDVSGEQNTFYIFNSSKVSINNSIIHNQDRVLIINQSSQIEIVNNTLENIDKGLEIICSNNVLIRNNKASKINENDGLFIENSTSVQVINNTISDCSDYGISSCNSSNSLIENNHIHENMAGIILYEGSKDNSIRSNNISANLFEGIVLDDVDFNYIINNSINQNDIGLSIEYSNNNTVSDNLLEYNTCNATNLKYSHNNSIINNYMFENENGIYLYASDDNLLQLNIIGPNNANNVFSINSLNNIWDKEGYGNLWSDYSDRYPAAKNNGIIWDTPYEIIGDEFAGTDNHPLAAMYGFCVSIVIDNNDDLARYADSGSGTEQDPYIIENRTVLGFNANDVVKISNTDQYLIIRNNSFQNSNYYPYNSGVHMKNVSNIMIFDNNFNDVYYGITINGSTNISISNNNILTARKHNTLDYYTIGILVNSSSNIQIERNQLCYFNYSSDTDLLSAGIELNYCEEINISNNKFSQNHVSVHMRNTSNSTIELNRFYSDNYYNIRLVNSERINITQNIHLSTIDDFYISYGISIIDSNSIRVQNNSVPDITVTYILTSQVSHCEFLNNTIHKALYNAIELYASTFNLIQYNYLKNSSMNGIKIIDNADNNTICYNWISNCSESGITIDNSVNNTIHHNTFMYNEVHALCNRLENYFDFEERGNYWGDYLDKYEDAVHNGIFWLTPYEIDEGIGIFDNYPLVNVTMKNPFIPDPSSEPEYPDPDPNDNDLIDIIKLLILMMGTIVLVITAFYIYKISRNAKNKTNPPKESEDLSENNQDIRK